MQLIRRSSKPACFRGIVFRSGLEARWAAFFDEVGLHWRYQPCTVDQEGIALTASFWLALPDIYVAVRAAYDCRDLATFKHFAKVTARPLLLVLGAPDAGCYSLRLFGEAGTNFECVFTDAQFAQKAALRTSVWIKQGDAALELARGARPRLLFGDLVEDSAWLRTCMQVATNNLARANGLGPQPA